MEMKSAAKSERTSYVFEIQKRYRKVIFPQCKKRHCLVVRKEGFFWYWWWFCFSPCKYYYVVVE